ncbi:MAG: 5-oxoprolinase/urea amidolyase family protein [Anaerolineae bacterium]|nr:5-oxoprolinase/urea amidolyase family protein [Anaerolineae bacterium]
MMGEPMLYVVEPGFQTTVQDVGRPGLGDQGISPAGAMDPLALRLGNLVVGNPSDAAALEMTLIGPTLRFDAEAVIALAGAPFEATLNPARLPGHAVKLPWWQAVRVQAGDTVALGPATVGSRAYLCVAGGLDTPLLHGSRATHLLAGLGGIEGRALRVGDRVKLGQPSQSLDRLAGRRLKRSVWPVYSNGVTVRVVLGPQAGRFTEAALENFLGQPYTVQVDSNRMGVRLSGPLLTHTQGADLLSEGIALGAVQVPASGQPIILMVERQTTGGYTKIATVISADSGLIGQARPGSLVRFQAVTVDEALAARRAQEALVDETHIEQRMEQAWGVAEVLAVMRQFADSGLGELRLATGGVKLVLRRDPALPTLPTSSSPTEQQAEPPSSGFDITAPLLGIFYIAPAPDAPPLVQAGARVEAGQVVALIDVMKTLHEVRAEQGGEVEAVLVDNGTLVEYGQPLIRLR